MDTRKALLAALAIYLLSQSNDSLGETSAARAATRVTTEPIPSQPLPAGLAALSHQTGLQIMYISEVADGRRSSPAPAGVPAIDALENMLTSTGLTFEFIDESTVDLKVIETRKPARPGDHPQPVAKEASPGSSAELDEVRVTAQKRTQSLQDVPLSIVAVSSATLQNFRVDTLADLAPLVPNLTVSNVVGTESVYLRGVGGGGRNVGFDTRTGIYIDGVYVGNAPAANAMLFDVDRVEVLRGPQGFLFGQSSDSGAISIVAKPPDGTFHTKESVTLGNDSIADAVASANWPLSDAVFVKASVSSDHSRGFTRNVLTGAYVDGVDEQAGRIQLRVLPRDALTVDLAGDFAQQRNHEVVGEARTNTFGTAPSGLGPFEVDNNTPEFNVFRNYGASATVTYHGSDAEVVSITAYRGSDRHWVDDLDHSALDIAGIDYLDRYSTFSQELRVAGAASGSFRYTAGLYLTDGSQSSERHIGFFSASELVNVAPGGKVENLPRVTDRSYSLFGSLDYDVLPDLMFNLGMRVTRDSKRLVERQMGDENLLQILPFFDVREAMSETSLTPTAGFNYKPAPFALLYLKYSRGAKAGGFNADFSTAPSPAALPFKQETANSYEAGLKSEWLGRRLRTNLALFLTDYKDYQLYQFNAMPGGLVQGSLQNAGAVRTYGPEFQIDAEPVPHLILSFTGAWLSARYVSFANGGGVGVDYSGHSMEFSPKWSLSNVLEYSRAIPALNETTGFVRMHVSYRSSQYTTPANQAPFIIDGYTVADAQIGVSKNEWTVNLFGKNLMNRRYDTSSTTDAFGPILGFRGTPRTYGVQLTFNTQ